LFGHYYIGAELLRLLPGRHVPDAKASSPSVIANDRQQTAGGGSCHPTALGCKFSDKELLSEFAGVRVPKAKLITEIVDKDGRFFVRPAE
jgi:hypothetical protein